MKFNMIKKIWKWIGNIENRAIITFLVITIGAVIGIYDACFTERKSKSKTQLLSEKNQKATAMGNSAAVNASEGSQINIITIQPTNNINKIDSANAQSQKKVLDKSQIH